MLTQLESQGIREILNSLSDPLLERLKPRDSSATSREGMLNLKMFGLGFFSFYKILYLNLDAWTNI